MPMITGKTRLIGIFGWPVEHSISPVFQNAAFDAMGLDFCYVPLPVHPEKLEDAVRGFRAMNFAGANVTIPHKERVIPFLDELSPAATLMGAVNTIEVKDGRLVGHNTDGDGFVRSLAEEGVKVAGARCLMVGAGGAARGVSVALARSGASRIVIANRNVDRAEELCRLIDKNFPEVETAAVSLNESVQQAANESDILIQSTPLGMKATDPLPVAAGVLRPDLVVCDLIYVPALTPLLREAASTGARTVGGLGMLLYQGAIACEIWTGREAPVSVMRDALLHRLSTML